MPTTLTLKNIPDAVYDRLKGAAELPSRVSPDDRLAHIRELRAALPAGPFTAKDIDAAKRAGRG